MISPWMRFIATIFVFAPFMVAHAQWNSDPASNNPICRSGNNQVAPKLVSDGKGGAIICWADERSSQNFYEVYAQRISGDGIVQWTQNGIAVAPLNNAQLKPEMISDDAGGAIVVWTDTRNGNIDIYAQRIDSSGNALWTVDGVAVAFGGMDQTDPKLTGDGNHGAIVTWSAHTGSSQDSHIYAQRIDGTGKLAWSQEVQVSSSDQFESSPCIAGDGSGGAYIAWSFYNNGQYDVFAQRLNAGGAPQWQFGGIGIATGNAPEAAPVLATDGTGKAFLAWHDWGFGSASVVQIAVLNPDGSTAASLRATSTSGGQENPRLSNIGPGLLGIAWEDGRVAMNTRAYAQIVDNTGTKSWAADGVAVSSRAGRQVTPFVISDGNGGMIVVWEDRTGGVTESDLYAQRIAADGSLLWSGTGVPLCTAGQMQSTPSMISDGENGAIVTWEDYRSSFSNPDVYAARILADGTFPVGPPILSFSSTTVDFGAVSVGSSATERITLTNTGGVPVTIASITTNDPHFSLTPDSSTMFPNSSVTASVRFQPTSKGALDATIVVESNSIHGPDTVFVTGTGTASAAIELDKASLDFGNVTTGSSKSLVLNISNPGNDTLTISSISTDNPAFTVAVTSRILEPGAAFDDTVHFSPTAPGLVTGELTVTSNAPTSPTIVPLSGTGIPVVTMTIDPEEISFGEVAIGFHRDTTLTVTNTGNDTLHISSFTSGDPRFTLETPIEGIAPAGFRTLTLRFTPDAVGPLSTVFTVTSNAETSPDTILVQGTGREVTAVRAVRVVPGAFTLFGNYPNPFNPSTTIRYDLETSTPVRVTVFNSLGKVVAILVDERQHPGIHAVQWIPEGDPPGIYFLAVRVGAHEAYGRMVLLR